MNNWEDTAHNLEPKAIDKAGILLLGEAVKRMRMEEIDISPGYDGEFGRVKIFKDQEHERLMSRKQPLTSVNRKMKNA